MSWVPAAIVLSVYGAYFFSNEPGLNWIGRIGWLLTIGICIAALTLCAAHELIHRSTRIERLLGGFLLSFVCHSDFKIEHIRGHHSRVAIPLDPSTARLGQSLYSFLLRAYRETIVDAWVLERKKLNRRGYFTLNYRNELIWWHALAFCIAATYYIIFGLYGVIFFAGQSAITLTAHHTINYIQHYGLERRLPDNGKYESFSAAHAWDSDFLLCNILTFQLPCHVDHHLNPRRPYQNLRYHAESPQMPMGYFAMFLMALIPRLWFKVMNPRVLSHLNE